MAADVAPSHAACKPTDPSATCLTFDPLTESNVLNRSGFTGVFSPTPGPGNAYNQVRLQFRFTGAWTVPFTLDQLSVKGDGITSSLSIPSKIINFATSEFDDNNSAWATLDTNISQLNFAHSLLSLHIPAGVAPDGATLEARIQYRSINQAQLNSSEGNFLTAARIPSDVPGPLPILGAGIGLAYSRRLRSRVRASA
ncbi:MAG: hypothetical protein VKK43_12405 [Synechococcaceae cyanobacterium]|nr:hypothetical protein [Synechococcaceae cyanobacterium]